MVIEEGRKNLNEVENTRCPEGSTEHSSESRSRKQEKTKKFETTTTSTTTKTEERVSR